MKIRGKINSNLGETIAETLVAVLIAAMSVVMVTTAIVVAARINDRVAKNSKDFIAGDTAAGYPADSYVEIKMSGSGEQGTSITISRNALVSVSQTTAGYRYYDYKEMVAAAGENEGSEGNG